MLCTITDYEGKVIQNQEKLKARSEILRKTIGRALRRSDVYAKYSASQYLVLLTGVREENCSVVGKRISRNFRDLSGKQAEVAISTDVTYAGGYGNDFGFLNAHKKNRFSLSCRKTG